MNNPQKIKFILLTVAAICLASEKDFAQTNREWTRFGGENQTAYIDVNRLKTTVRRTGNGISDFMASGVEKKSFYPEGGMHNGGCAGGSLPRGGVAHYCLPFAALGYELSTGDNPEGGFVPVGNRDVEVFYEKSRNVFYFFGGLTYFNEAVGPFTGNPLIEIPKAVKPRKSRRSFPDIESRIISQRWLYPNEADAKVPRDDNYDFVGGRMSGRQIERTRLETFFTTIRLTNNGGKDLYYLGGTLAPSSRYPTPGKSAPVLAINPTGRLLSKSVAAASFYNPPPAPKLNPGLRSMWTLLPKRSHIEFEIEAVGYPKTENSYLLYLNDEPDFWNEIEVMTAVFPSMYREFTDDGPKR